MLKLLGNKLKKIYILGTVMGSDLSVVFRACVPAQDFLCNVYNEQKLGVAAGEGHYKPILYNELRLVDGNSFSSGSLVTLLNEKEELSAQVIVPQCSPEMLSKLNLEDTEKFLFLHGGLQCGRCAGRVALAIDSSVCIGQRMYSAEQRRLFTYGISLFLSKLVPVIKNTAAFFQAPGFGGTGDESPVADDLVKTPCKKNACVRHELFLLDLQDGLLDNVSGPWIVRDFVGHMGRLPHHQTALSFLYGGPHAASTMLLDTTQAAGGGGGGDLAELLSPNRASIQISADITCDNAKILAFDPAQVEFCRSLRHVILSNNNMSLIGMRRCVLEFLNWSEHEGFRLPIKYLRTIDVRKNEESVAAQRFVAEVASFTGVNLLIGTSGMRWRHRSAYLANDSVSRVSVRSVSVTHSLFECNLKRLSFINEDVLEDRQRGNNVNTPTHCPKKQHFQTFEKCPSTFVADNVDVAAAAVDVDVDVVVAAAAAAASVAGDDDVGLNSGSEGNDTPNEHNDCRSTETCRSIAADEVDAAINQECELTEERQSVGGLSKEQQPQADTFGSTKEAANVDFAAASTGKARAVHGQPSKQGCNPALSKDKSTNVQYKKNAGKAAQQQQTATNKKTSHKLSSAKAKAATRPTGGTKGIPTERLPKKPVR